MTKDPQIVVITHDQDAHVPFVAPHLPGEPIILDPASILDGAGLSYTIDKGKMVVAYKGTTLNNVRAVWYRKPRDFDKDYIPVPARTKHYAHSALQEHCHMLRGCFQGAFWLSDYYQIKRAENKAWQLVLAAHAGFKTPRTLMTSLPDEAQYFISSCNQTIVKSLAKYSIYDAQGAPKAFFATKIKPSDEAALKGLHLAPAIFQEAIEPDIDVRVHVIGDTVLAASIKTIKIDKTVQPVRDWKVGHFKGDLQIKPITLPENIRRACIRHTRLLGLEFGVLDLVRDKEGTYWFLENNPNGQWAFVEESTGQPISKTIANLICKRAELN